METKLPESKHESYSVHLTCEHSNAAASLELVIQANMANNHQSCNRVDKRTNQNWV